MRFKNSSLQKMLIREGCNTTHRFGHFGRRLKWSNEMSRCLFLGIALCVVAVCFADQAADDALLALHHGGQLASTISWQVSFSVARLAKANRDAPYRPFEKRWMISHDDCVKPTTPATRSYSGRSEASTQGQTVQCLPQRLTNSRESSRTLHLPRRIHHL
jgi:hypothetical protein